MATSIKKDDYCYGMEEVLSVYRLRRSGSAGSNKPKEIKYHWQLYHLIEKHNAIRSIVEIMSWAFVKVTGAGYRKEKTNG